MAFTAARDYIKARLLEVDSQFREHKDGFNRDNIARNILNKSYFITLSNPANNETYNCRVDDSISVVLELFYRGGKTSTLQDSLDTALDLGHDVKLQASNLSRLTGGIKKCVGNSVKADPLETNDNSFIITVEFTLRVINSVT